MGPVCAPVGLLLVSCWGVCLEWTVYLEEELDPLTSLPCTLISSSVTYLDDPLVERARGRPEALDL